MLYIYVNDISVRRRKGKAGKRKEKRKGVRKEIVLLMMIVLLEGC